MKMDQPPTSLDIFAAVGIREQSACGTSPIAICMRRRLCSKVTSDLREAFIAWRGPGGGATEVDVAPGGIAAGGIATEACVHRKWRNNIASENRGKALVGIATG